MKNIGAFVPFIVIAALVAAAIFGGRLIGHTASSSSDKQFASMNLSSIMASPTKVSIAVNQTSSNLSISAIHTQNGSSNGALKVVTNNLSFKSNNVQVAVVTAGGQITGVAAGTTTVTVSFAEGAVTKTCDVPVTITAPPGT